MRLRNISAVPAIVSLTLENENFEGFDIHPWEITIQVCNYTFDDFNIYDRNFNFIFT